MEVIELLWSMKVRTTFVKMHNSPEHEKVHPAGHAFMSGPPQRKTYTVAAE